MTIINNLLQRYSDDGESTLGLLFVDKRFGAYTLEDEHRAVKVAGETRVDAGFYELAPHKIMTPLTAKYRERFPDWFSWHVEIIGCPRHQNVYLHVGNTEKNTDACVLLGDTANNNVAGDGLIGESVKAYRRWYEQISAHLLNGGQSFIEIRDETKLFDIAK